MVFIANNIKKGYDDATIFIFRYCNVIARKLMEKPLHKGFNAKSIRMNSVRND